MAESKLEIIITAKDQASGPLGKIGNAIGNIATTAGGFLVANVISKIADSVTGFFSDSIAEATESIAVHKQLEQVIKSTGGVAGITAEEADKLATSLSQVTNFSDDTIISAENMLLTFTNVGEKVFPRATETILDMSQALGQDTKSSAIQLGKALNDPIKGITALTRVGVTFTDEQKNMIKAMVEAGDIAGAQGVILDELAKEFGGSAQALADPAIQLKNAWANFQEEVGMAVLPVLNDLAQQALPLLTQGIQLVLPYIKDFGVIFGDLVKYIIAVVEDGDVLNDWLTHLPESFQPIAKVIGEIIVSLQDFASWFINEGWPAIQPFLDQVVTQLVPGLQELGVWVMDLATVAWPLLQQAIQFVIDNFNIFGPILAVVAGLLLTLSSPITAIIALAVLLATAWANNWGGIQEKTQAVLDFLAPYWEQLKTVFNNFIDELLPVLQETWNELVLVWETSVQPALADLWAALQDLFVSLGFGTGETDFFQIAMDTLKTILDSVISVIQILTPLIRGIGNAISFSIDMTTNIIEAFNSFEDGVRGVSSAVSGLIGRIQSLVSRLASIRIPSALLGHSPSPFEESLRGIAEAIRTMPELEFPERPIMPVLSPANRPSSDNPAAVVAAPRPNSVSSNSGGGSIIVHLNYHPVLSTADAIVLERILGDTITQIHRRIHAT